MATTITTVNETAISLPFSLSSFGKVADTTDQKKIWQDRVLSVIGTAMYERVMRPNFGTSITSYMFDNQDTAQAEIKNEVTNAFGSQLTKLKLVNTVTTFDTYSETVSVTITYSLPNSDVVTTVIATALINNTAPLFEENL